MYLYNKHKYIMDNLNEEINKIKHLFTFKKGGVINEDSSDAEDLGKTKSCVIRNFKEGNRGELDGEIENSINKCETYDDLTEYLDKLVEKNGGEYGNDYINCLATTLRTSEPEWEERIQN